MGIENRVLTFRIRVVLINVHEELKRRNRV